MTVKPYEEKYRQAKLIYLYKKKLYNQARRTRSPQKKARTAFTFYVESLKGRTLPEGVDNFMKYAAGKWEKLDSKQKEQFEKLAEEDKIKVEKKNERSHPENRVYDKPKKPLTAFMAYVNDHRKEDESQTDAVKRLSSEWEDMKQKEKEKYEETFYGMVLFCTWTDAFGGGRKLCASDQSRE